MLKKIHFYTILIVVCFISYSWIILNVINYKKSTFSLSICTLKNITGVPCASCGTTRSILYFFKGDFLNAIFYNPLGVLVSLILLAIPPYLIYELFTKKNIVYKKYYTTQLNKKFWLYIILSFGLAWAWNIYKYFNQLDF